MTSLKTLKTTDKHVGCVCEQGATTEVGGFPRIRDPNVKRLHLIIAGHLAWLFHRASVTVADGIEGNDLSQGQSTG